MAAGSADPQLNRLSALASALGSTALLVQLFVLVGSLTLAITRRWRPLVLHFPTDVLGSLLLASIWLGACWRVLWPNADAEPGAPP